MRICFVVFSFVALVGCATDPMGKTQLESLKKVYVEDTSAFKCEKGKAAAGGCLPAKRIEAGVRLFDEALARHVDE
jgi:hypothetical protein